MENSNMPEIVNLPEALLLLAIDDETGRVESKSGALDLGLGGAVLAEAFLMNRLAIDDGKVFVLDGSPTGDSMLDRAIREIADSRPHDAKHWVDRLSKDHIREAVLGRLMEKGVLRQEEHRILWIISASRYPAQKDSPERDIREATRAAVLQGGLPQPRTLTLIGFMKACDLLGTVFSRDERKRYKQRIEDIAKAEVMSEAVSRAVKEAEAATAAVIASTAVVTTSGSG
jgi:hypothetical protein